MNDLSIGRMSGQTIAVCRFLLALMILALATTEHGRLWFDVEPDDLIAIAYLAVASFLLTISFADWWLDFRLLRGAILLDIVAFAGVTLFFRDESGGLDRAGLTSVGCGLMAQILIAVALRENRRLAAYFAVLLNLYWLASWLTLDPGHIGIAGVDVLRNSINGMFVSILVVAGIAGISNVTVPRFEPLETYHAGLLLQDALAYAMRVSGARGAAIAWVNVHEPHCTVARAGTLGENTAHHQIGDFVAATGINGPALFDVPRERIIELIDGSFGARRGGLANDDFIGFLDAETGICIPIEGISGTTRLILTGVPRSGWGTLRFAEALGEEVTRGLNRQKTQAIVRETGDLRMRQALARDLHDTIAQSLAGTHYWLGALKARIRKSKDPAAEIDQVRQSLEHEKQHVGEVIAQLRKAEQAAETRDLADDLAALLAVLSLHWRVTVRLEECTGHTVVPMIFSYDIQRMLREAVSNAVRHGGASEIAVRCECGERIVSLTITDNGTGFDPSDPVPVPRSIRERVSDLGGVLDVESQAGSTSLEMTLPVPAFAANGASAG